MATEERQQEFAELLRRAEKWARMSADVAAVAVVGSWARGEQRMDSDVDLVVVVDRVEPYVQGDDWMVSLGGTAMVRTQKWGLSQECRFVLDSGLEVETGFVTRQWTTTNPVEAGTRRVVSDGMRIVYDPEGILSAVQIECDQQR